MKQKNKEPSSTKKNISSENSQEEKINHAAKLKKSGSFKPIKIQKLNMILAT